METSNGSTPTMTQNTEPSQPNGQTAAKDPGVIKLSQYKHIDLCQGCGQHGYVYFVDNPNRAAVEKRTVEMVCRLMDDESAKKFREDVARLQAEGMLVGSLTGNERSKPRMAADTRENLQKFVDRLSKLNEEAGQAWVAGLSDFALVKIVMDSLTGGLEDSELNMVFKEMDERVMKINISVTDPTGEVISLTLNPNNLICDDVSDQDARIDADFQELLKEVLDDDEK